MYTNRMHRIVALLIDHTKLSFQALLGTKGKRDYLQSSYTLNIFILFFLLYLLYFVEKSKNTRKCIGSLNYDQNPSGLLLLVMLNGHHYR